MYYVHRYEVNGRLSSTAGVRTDRPCSMLILRRANEIMTTSYGKCARAGLTARLSRDLCEML